MQAEKERRTALQQWTGAKRKTGVRRDNFMTPNRFDMVESGLLDSSSKLKSDSKEDAREPLGNGDEVFSILQRNRYWVIINSIQDLCFVGNNIVGNGKYLEKLSPCSYSC